MDGVLNRPKTIENLSLTCQTQFGYPIGLVGAESTYLHHRYRKPSYPSKYWQDTCGWPDPLATSDPHCLRESLTLEPNQPSRYLVEV